MNIYQAEASVPGLAEQILSNRTLAYTSCLSHWLPTERDEVIRNNLIDSFNTVASNRGYTTVASALDSDLYFTKSIFVSTNWNKNDDVFSPANVWEARHTPSHKRTNLEHDDHAIVGHITNTWALDSTGALIPDNTLVDDLPEFYHLANGAVIYTTWKDDKLKARAEKLIEEVEAGKKFVSMEALFTNFDYAVITPEKEFHIIARNKESSFLTKHLRAYKGSGNFDGCTIGRLLRNITFSGKGYVDDPANPFSSIFNNEPNTFNYSTASKENPFKIKSGVFILRSESSNKKNMEKESMSDTLEFLKSQNEKLENTIATLNAKVDEMTKASSEAGVKALQSEVADLKSKLDSVMQELASAKLNSEKLGTEKLELEKQLSVANEAKLALENEVSLAKAQQVKSNRVSYLILGGVAKEVAESKVEIFVALNDEQFNSVASDIILAAKASQSTTASTNEGKKPEDNKDDETIDPKEGSADAKVLDNVKPNDGITLAANPSHDASEVESLREELASMFADRLNLSSKKKDS